MANHYFFTSLLAGAVLTAATSASAQGFEPVAPGNLQAEVQGIMVNLSWEWGNAGEDICSGSFEEEGFSAPWSVKNTYSFAPETGGNWMVYDFTDYPDEPLNHDGSRAALLMMAGDGDGDDLTTFHQDEWLIARPGTGAVYMDFWYFLHQELREVGGYPDFPDHYYVMISRDNGQTWSELWDGRWDMGPTEGMQQASLFLGEPTDENTLVAFNAVSAEEESLYFLWTIDDVHFYTAEQAGDRSLRMSSPQARHPLALNPGISLYRKFSPADRHAKAARRAPESEWLNGGNTTYRVYLDGELIADYLKARSFSDVSSKTSGQHIYSVKAWSEAKDLEYAEASVTADIEDYSFAPARNIQASYEAQDNGRYTISTKWEAPDNELQPDHYNVYVNGKSIGWISSEEELEMGQSGLFKGVYTFAVQACYTLPDGESDMIYATVFPGTVPTPSSLTVDCAGNNAEISWGTPEQTDNAPTAFRLYRGTELLYEGDALAYTDSEVPDGSYDYSVHAVYADGSVSLPVTSHASFGDAVVMEMPYSQDFASAHTPAGWSVELNDPRETVKDMYTWRFDNWFDTEFPQTAGLQDCFASVSGTAAGMNRLETYLVSPAFRIPADTDAAISFDKYYFEEKPGPSGSAQFVLQVTMDNGENWFDAEDLAAAPNGRCTVYLTDYMGQDIRFRWAFMSRNSGVAAIDNVDVHDASGVAEIGTDGTATMDVYTVDGVIVARGISMETVRALPVGMYIIRNGSKTSKVMVR